MGCRTAEEVMRSDVFGTGSLVNYEKRTKYTVTHAWHEYESDAVSLSRDCVGLYNETSGYSS